MKRNVFKILSILLATMLFTMVLSFSVCAEEVSPCDASSHQHYFQVTTIETFNPISDQQHCRVIYKLYSCLTCDVDDIIVEEATYVEYHENEGSSYESYDYFSDDHHYKEWHVSITCIWCGENNDYITDSCFEYHEIDETLDTSYDYYSDEYHVKSVRYHAACLWCGWVKSSSESTSNEWHDFGPYVDPEVDMEGVCIHCGAEIAW